MRQVLVILAIVAIGVAGWFGYKHFTLNQSDAPEAVSAEAGAEEENPYFTEADRFVDIAGARVRVREEGPSDAPVFLMIHGFSFSLESFDAWAEDLKSDYRVIRYDLLGHGLTGPDPQERYAPAERAAFIGEVMKALEIDQAIIAGNSLGGLAAWRFAADNPEKVSALVLISPGAYPLNGVSAEPAPLPPAMKAYLLTAPKPAVRASAQLIFGDDSKITDERIDVLHAMMTQEGNGAAMIRSIEKFVLPDPEPDLARITSPTLVLWGKEDRVIPVDNGSQMVAVIPDAELITYESVGHAAHEEVPAQSLADLKAFLAKHSEE